MRSLTNNTKYLPDNLERIAISYSKADSSYPKDDDDRTDLSKDL
jgi:hypothetical protein